MNKKIGTLLVFISGATIGGLGMYCYMETKFEEIEWGEENPEVTYGEADAEYTTAVYEATKDQPLAGEAGFTSEEQEAMTKAYEEIADNYKGPHVVNSPRKPYRITEEQYSDECFEFDKVQLRWYTEDECMVDEYEEIVVDWERRVGVELVKAITNHVDDMLYCRNEMVSVDHEIIVIDGSFSDFLMAETDELVGE